MASSFFNIKVIQSGDRMELFKYSLSQVKGFESRNKNGRKGNGGMTNKIKNRRETLNRDRNTIIRLANCNPDMLTFISLTYKENFQDLKTSKHHVHMMCKALQKDCDNFKYLYVLEFQSRGAIHYHMLCNYPVHVKTAKTRNLKPQEQKLLEKVFYDKYWNHGFVDIRDLSQEGNTNAGLYVSVYLVEDLYKLELNGAKCYGHSRNLSKPIESTAMTTYDNEDILTSINETHQLKYASNYEVRYEKDGMVRTGNVNYFDFYKKINN